MISASILTHPGLVRERNEDTILLPGLATISIIESPLHMYFGVGPMVFAVIDGMGGHRGGQEASLLIAQHLARDRHLPVQTALGRANTAVYEAMEGTPNLSGMGAVVAGISIQDSTATVFNVGDARAYLLSGDYLVLVTIDDRMDSSVGVVSQSLGGYHRHTEIDPHLATLALEDGDRVLLCSDGLSESVSFDSIQESMRQPDIDAVATDLLRCTLQNGAPDNVSIVVLEYEARG
jgi:serine/threonine protein phosphatase PrpC